MVPILTKEHHDTIMDIEAQRIRKIYLQRMNVINGDSLFFKDKKDRKEFEASIPLKNIK